MWYPIVVWLCLMLFLGISRFAVAGDRVTGRAFATRSEVIARNGMACTSQPLATQIALEVLKRGGSAVDAAIAANAALGLMEPTGNGIGGDLFALVWDAGTGKLHALNASGRSPRGLSLSQFRELKLDAVPDFGPLPVTVPGCVDGWFELHERFGRLPMSEVLGPAIRYAREGFPVSELIAYYWSAGEKLREHPGFAETFLPGGKAPGKGDVFRNPMLAASLEKIAAGGREVFYRGEISSTIDAFCRRTGCYLRAEDLALHRSEWVDPISTNYRGFEVWQIGPNTQGATVLQMLNMLESLDVAGMEHNGTAYLHRMIEVKKIAYEDRARFFCDPEFASVPLERLLSKEYARERLKLLNPKRASRTIAPGTGMEAVRELRSEIREADGMLRGGDTIYLAVADKDRNMVSLIQSNYRGFGSGLCPDGLGFCLQDRGALFSLQAGHPNVYEPGKRPFHTIIPGFVTRGGKPWLAFGVMGGDMQPQGQVQVLCNLIDFGMNVQEAGDAARWYHTGSSEPSGRVGGVDAPDAMKDGGTVSLESGVLPETVRELSKMGHRIGQSVGAFGGYQAILYDVERDVYSGASESRKDGQAAGY